MDMEDEEGALLAIRKLDGSDWSGRRLQVMRHPCVATALEVPAGVHALVRRLEQPQAAGVCGRAAMLYPWLDLLWSLGSDGCSGNRLLRFWCVSGSLQPPRPALAALPVARLRSTAERSGHGRRVHKRFACSHVQVEVAKRPRSL